MLDALKPKKSTIILYLIIPVAMFVFTVFVPLVTVTLSPDAAPVKISSTLLRELKQSDIKRQI